MARLRDAADVGALVGRWEKTGDLGPCSEGLPKLLSRPKAPLFICCLNWVTEVDFRELPDLLFEYAMDDE